MSSLTKRICTGSIETMPVCTGKAEPGFQRLSRNDSFFIIPAISQWIVGSGAFKLNLTDPFKIFFL